MFPDSLPLGRRLAFRAAEAIMRSCAWLMRTLAPDAFMLPAMAAAADDRVGLCPHCLAAGEHEHGAWAVRIVGCRYYLLCAIHDVYWLGGTNITQLWRLEPETHWRGNAAVLRRMTRVEPAYLPDTTQALRIAESLMDSP